MAQAAARHILVATEADCTDLKRQIVDGAVVPFRGFRQQRTAGQLDGPLVDIQTEDAVGKDASALGDA